MSKAQQLAQEAAQELERAQAKFGPMVNPHEGWAVLREEVDELWDVVKRQSKHRPRQDMEAMREEAIQVAAMALRFIHDVVDPALEKLGQDTQGVPL